MKTIQMLSIVSLLMLTACNNSKPSAQTESSDDVEPSIATSTVDSVSQPKPSYNATDALAFGLKGHVQSVTTQYYGTETNDGQLKEGDCKYTREISFNPLGLIVHDEWNNEYGYDADGNYYRGNHVYTKVERDKGGKIVKYIDEEPQVDNESNQTLSFSYDKNNRIIKIEKTGWTEVWTEKREYKGGNIYPEKATTEGTFEGGGAFTTTETYRYNHFDDKGNWTERICIESSTETEYDSENDSGEQTTIEETITIEKRTISYYD